jgi:2-C-methyl-D-erythritol 4-phosphate cytidylyltransferase
VRSAVILCAGNSLRFSAGSENKTLYLLNGKPIFVYSLETLTKVGFDLVVLVVKPDEKKKFEKYIQDEEIRIINGGKRRQDSVMNALEVIPAESAVLIHDGARPFLTVDLIKRVLNDISSKRCVVPAIKSEDALRIEDGGKYRFVDRNKIFRMQTPQGCIAGELLDLYRRFFEIDLLDDAMAFEMANLDVHLVDGDKKNIKVTTKDDVY